MATQECTINGVTLAYQDHPAQSKQQKGTIVFLPGWGFGACMGLVAFQNLTQQGYRLISFDMPGVGTLKENSSFVYIPRMAKAIANFLREQQMNEVIIAGHSFGTMVAQEMALSEDDVVGKLILFGPLPGVGVSNSQFGAPNLSSAMATLNRLLSGQESIFDYLYPAGYLTQLKTTLGDMFEELQRPASAAALSGQVWAASRWTNWGRVEQIYQPTLVIQGQKDPLTDMASTQRFVKQVKGCELQTPECGYFPFWEHAEETQKAVLTFIK